MTAKQFEKIIKHLKKQKIINEKTKQISLFNWGEPFLNPELNEILEVLNKYNLKAVLSSNFIKYPNIKNENYKTISTCYFSICSLDPIQYKRIYGANLDKVLENFEKFVYTINEHNPQPKIKINWLKYKFNENELENAQKYFTQDNVKVTDNYYAYLNDGYALVNYLKTGKAEGYNLDEIYQDLYQERMNNALKHGDPTYPCSLKNNEIMINESGELALCCTVTSKNKEYNLGNVLKMNSKKILKLKTTQAYCKECEELCLPWFALNGNTSFIVESVPQG